MKFTKMHGAGNDFVIINNMVENIPVEQLPELAKKLCRQHLCVGADGMMVVVPAENGGDFAMLFFNSDGSMGEMCGNGARCICRYGYEKGLSAGPVRVETTAGLVIGERIDSRNYRIRLNDPSLINPHGSACIDGNDYDCAYVELGCPGLPHAVVEIPGLSAMDRDELRELGRKLRFWKDFPKGANVNFVEIKGADLVDIITFERGVEDFTLACGTGCGSTAAVLFRRGLCGRKLNLHAPGGELMVELLGSGNEISDIYLTGPTCIAFEAETKEI